MPTKTHTRQIGLLVPLITLLAAIYLLTYSADIESGDALQFFDAVSSQVRFGDWLLDESWFQGRSFYTASNGPLPLKTLYTERLHIIAAMPLYLLADAIPWVGYVHAVWLFNGIVSIATCVLLYGLVRALGYEARTALLTALALGLCTMVWVYSKTFFRGPLAMLCITGAAYALHLWRTGGYLAGWRAALRLIVALLCILGAVLTKTSALVALPALLIVALPNVAGDKRSISLLSLLGLALLLLGTLASVYLDPVYALFEQILQWQPFISINSTNTTYIREALHAYLFSIGGSIWGTSPILLLALYGAWRLLKANQGRWLWVGVLLLLAYAYGHALLTESHWFGGLSWPPRFLLPTLPLLTLLLAPALDALWQVQRRGLLYAVFGLIVLYSVWVQFNGVALQFAQYGYVLPTEANGVLSWSAGMNNLAYLRWVLLPGLWDSVAFDFAWVRAGYPAFGVALMGLALVSVAMLWRHLRKPQPHPLNPPLQTRELLSRQVIVALLLSLALILVLLAGLRALYAEDGLSWGRKDALHDVLDVLRDEAQAGDVVVLADPTYHRFVLNYNDLPDVRFITLEHQPGESPSPRQPAQVSGDYPADLLSRSTPLTLDHLAAHHKRIWLLVANSDFTDWAVRPVEQYLAERYFLLRDVPLANPDPTVRLLEFSTVHSQDPYALYNPLLPTDIRYGQHIRLLGYHLPGGDRYAGGDVLPIALYWQTDAALALSYRSAWFLADAETGAVVVHGSAGQDRPPDAGFAPTNTWQAGVPVWDNRALRIPQDIAPGEYVLWLALYTVEDGQIQHLSVQADATALAGTMAVLPTRIRIHE